MNFLWKYISSLQAIHKPNDATICIVMGFPRSGTSLLSNIVEGAGFNFGNDLRHANDMNPLGFFENRKILRESENMLKQCNFSFNNFDKDSDMLARPFRKLGRLRSRYVIAKEMNAVISKSNKSAFKLTPIPFHLVKTKLPEHKILGIYRNPIDAIASNMHTGKKNYTLDQLAKRWAAINEEMLYHVIENEGLLISYDELTNPDFTNKVLNAVAKYLESKSVDPSLIKPSLKRTNASIYFENIYEPNLEVARILRSLENYKKVSTIKYS